MDDLRVAIPALTKDDPLHVKRLSRGGWSDFLHILLDEGPVWIKRVLYSHQACHVETREDLKLLLAAADPWVAMSSRAPCPLCVMMPAIIVGSRVSSLATVPTRTSTSSCRIMLGLAGGGFWTGGPRRS